MILWYITFHRLLQPLDVGLFGPFQHRCAKAECYFLTTGVSINRDTFFPLHKNAQRLVHTTKSIENVSRAYDIVRSLTLQMVMDRLQAPRTHRNMAVDPLALGHTPYIKSELRQQTVWAVNFVRT